MGNFLINRWWFLDMIFSYWLSEHCSLLLRVTWLWLLAWGGVISAHAGLGDPFSLADREPIVLRGQQGIRLEALRIEHSPSIVLEDCRDVVVVRGDIRSVRLMRCENVTIINCYIHDAPEPAISLDDCENVRIQGNRFERVASGVYAHRGSGIRVLGNICWDVQGPIPRGQLVQFDQVTAAGNEIAYNHAINRAGASQPEDLINLHKTTGTPGSWVLVHHNILLGDPHQGSEGKSDSGSGIMLGDGGGQYQRAQYNLLISPGQVGIGVAGGAAIEVTHNRVRGDLSDVSNVGIYAWNQYADVQPGGSIVITHNQVFWTNTDDQPNPFWDGGGFASVQQHDNDFDCEELKQIDPPTIIDAKYPPMPDPADPRFSWDADNDTTGLGTKASDVITPQSEPPPQVQLDSSATHD